MASLSFRNCACGIKFRVVQELDHQRQRYACICGRQFEFQGTVIHLHFTAGAPKFFNATEWVQVPESKIQKLD